jgi:hypothetical protein
MIAASLIVSIVLLLALSRYLPPLAGMDEPGARMIVALKCVALATLSTLVAGVEAVAHERFEAAAFDPHRRSPDPTPAREFALSPEQA